MWRDRDGSQKWDGSTTERQEMRRLMFSIMVDDEALLFPNTGRQQGYSKYKHFHTYRIPVLSVLSLLLGMLMLNCMITYNEMN